jgi:hypothetical protein
MSTLNEKIIRPSLDFVSVPDDTFFARCNSVYNGLNGNDKYTGLPVALPTFKGALDAYGTSMAAAEDGGKQALADRRKKRVDLTITMRLLAHFVEVACNGDMATFLSSGFLPATTAKQPPQPLDQPTIEKITQLAVGEVIVSITPVDKARNYELHYAAVVAGGAPPSWTTITLPSVRAGVVIAGLTSGSTYSFQVRAYGKLGWTEWSDTVSKPCM